MYTYKIEVVRKETFQPLETVLAHAEARLNEWAMLGWELDKIMPLEANGYSSGAILVFRKTI